jgi:glycosyltransferase involved in cell wall biosynthesis
MIGIPVLATTVGGIPEMIIDGHTGFLTEPVPVQMAEKLIEVMALKGRRLSQIAENAKLFALVRTEPNQIFSKWLEIYKELSIAR